MSHRTIRAITAACVTVLGLGTAFAGGKKAPPAKPAPVAAPTEAAPAAPAPPPASREKAVGELMGPFKWGMSVDETVAGIESVIAEKHAAEMKKTTDVYVQNRIRKETSDEAEQVRGTFIDFQGQKTGWDVSIIEGEFLQKNDESMLTFSEIDPATHKDQQRFFFFYKGKLWKMFIAFNMDAYKGKTFADFRSAMEGRYGQGEQQLKRGTDGKERVASVNWTSGNTLVRAIDLFQFYSNFCLALSDRSVEDIMKPIRESRTPKHPVPKGTVSDGAGPIGPPVNDPNTDIINQITVGSDPATPEK